jgi:hypothetical protein
VNELQVHLIKDAGVFVSAIGGIEFTLFLNLKRPLKHVLFKNITRPARLIQRSE